MRGLIVGLILFGAIVGGFSLWRYDAARAAEREHRAEMARDCAAILAGIEERR